MVCVWEVGFVVWGWGLIGVVRGDGNECWEVKDVVKVRCEGRGLVGG